MKSKISSHEADSIEFFDRLGKSYRPQHDAQNVIDRKGVFALCLSNDHVLMIWPDNAPDVAELPGGGVDKGEGDWQALVREVHEETGLDLVCDEAPAHYMQSVRFYAENSDEFWFYDQSFYVLKGNKIDQMYFEGRRETPEDGHCSWVLMADLETTKLHHMHRIAIKAALEINE